MRQAEVQQIYDYVHNEPDHRRLTQTVPVNPYIQPGKRTNSATIEDGFFGDSGKGSGAQKVNNELKEFGPVTSIRTNGGSNAGHEIMIDEQPVVLHQIPVGVTQEGATGVISRGVVLHVEDAVKEKHYLEDKGVFLGGLIIDERAPLAMDTHRAAEATSSSYSTGRGIAKAYGDIYERRAVTVKDLMDGNWDKIRDHYEWYSKLMSGFGMDLASMNVQELSKGQNHQVGSFPEFLDRLKTAGDELRPFVSSGVYEMLEDLWSRGNKKPVTFEYAQGPGLDPYFGVYNDVTSSRPLSHNIIDPTYGIVHPDTVAARFGVVKSTYLSSIGSRRLPHIDNGEGREQWIQKAFDERGRTTGNPRDVYPINIPMAQALRRAAGYSMLIATHADAAKVGEKIDVVIGMRDRTTGKEAPYLPYQDHLDKLEPVTISFDGWDGQAIKDARTPDDFPVEAKRFYAFLSRTIAPVGIVTSGPEISNYVSFLPNR